MIIIKESYDTYKYRVWYNPYLLGDEEDYIEVTASNEDEARRKGRSEGYVTYVELIENSLVKESNGSSPIDLARYFLEKDYSDEEVWNELDKDGYDDDFIRNVIAWMNDLYEEQNEYTGFDEPYGHIW